MQKGNIDGNESPPPPKKIEMNVWRDSDSLFNNLKDALRGL